MTPKQLSELSDNDIYVMSESFYLYERKKLESATELLGPLLGASWSVDALTQEDSIAKDDDSFKWKLKPDNKRVSLPLSLVIGGGKVLEHVKKVASEMKLASRKDPSIMNLPKSGFIENYNIVDLSKVPKKDFIKFAKKIGS